MPDVIDNSQVGAVSEGIPEGGVPAENNSGVVETQSGLAGVGEVKPEGTTGVVPYSEDEISRLDVTAVDYSRVTSDLYPKLHKRYISVQDEIAREQARRAKKEVQRQVDELKRKLEESNSPQAKLLERLAAKEVAEHDRSLSEEQQAEQAYYESLSDEGKGLYQRMRKDFQRELAKISKNEVPDDVKKKLAELDDVSKYVSRQREREQAEQIGREIDFVVDNSGLPEVLRKDKEFAETVRANIAMKWNSERAMGLNPSDFTPPGVAAKEFISNFMKWNKIGVSPATSNVATTAVQATTAPPKLNGSSGGSKSPLAGKTQAELDEEYYKDPLTFWQKHGEAI